MAESNLSLSPACSSCITLFFSRTAITSLIIETVFSIFLNLTKCFSLRLSLSNTLSLNLVLGKCFLCILVPRNSFFFFYFWSFRWSLPPRLNLPIWTLESLLPSVGELETHFLTYYFVGLSFSLSLSRSFLLWDSLFPSRPSFSSPRPSLSPWPVIYRTCSLFLFFTLSRVL